MWRAPQHTPAWHLPWVILEPYLSEPPRECWREQVAPNREGCHRAPLPPWSRMLHLQIAPGYTGLVSPGGSGGMPVHGAGGRDGPAPPGLQEGGNSPLYPLPAWGWIHTEAAAEGLTAGLGRKQGEREQQVLSLQAHSRKAAGSCSPQMQHLQPGHPSAPGKPPAAAQGCIPPPGLKVFPICVVQ